MRGRRSCSTKARKYRLPKGVSYIQDTREQLPYRWNEPTIVQKLYAGDYSITGLEIDGVVGERKSLPDILGCVPATGSREREERKLQRMMDYQMRFLIVESSLWKIMSGKEPCFSHTKVSPNALLGTLEAWSLRYQLPIWFCTRVKEASETMQRLLWRAYRYLVHQGNYVPRESRCREGSRERRLRS